MARRSAASSSNAPARPWRGANLGFEQKLRAAADALRNTLTREQIDAVLPRVDKGLRQYLCLQAYVAGHDAFDDREFRRRYNGFYRVRRGSAWQDAFYGLMGRAKREGLQFPAVLRALHEDTNRYEASFASKLTATIDPSAPIIDSIVLNNLGLRLPYPTAPNREIGICTLHQQLASLFRQFLRAEDGKYLVKQFRQMYPTADITEVKMVDLVLWQSRKP
jgi:hypothetical protein